jgi:hypothetical protein
MMINFNEKIINGKSIGNINIDDSIDKWMGVLHSQNLKVEINKFSDEFTEYIIADGVICIVVENETKLINNLSCNEGYSGKFNDCFFTGMSVKNILDLDCYTIILHGFLIIDNSMNIGFSLPNELSDFDYINELPEDLVLNKIYIMKDNWWK